MILPPTQWPARLDRLTKKLAFLLKVASRGNSKGYTCPQQHHFLFQHKCQNTPPSQLYYFMKGAGFRTNFTVYIDYQFTVSVKTCITITTSMNNTRLVSLVHKNLKVHFKVQSGQCSSRLEVIVWAFLPLLVLSRISTILRMCHFLGRIGRADHVH